MNAAQADRPGMGARRAAVVKHAIILLCFFALLCIFQPFALWLFTLGAGLVVLGGLAFNLVPLCRPEVPVSSIVKVGLVVLTILAVVICLALGFTELYRLYLRS